MSEYMASKMDDLIEAGKTEYEQMAAENESLRDRIAALEASIETITSRYRALDLFGLIRAAKAAPEQKP